MPRPKAFVATIVLQLVAEGRVGLDAPVSRGVVGAEPGGPPQHLGEPHRDERSGGQDARQDDQLEPAGLQR